MQFLTIVFQEKYFSDLECQLFIYELQKYVLMNVKVQSCKNFTNFEML